MQEEERTGREAYLPVYRYAGFGFGPEHDEVYARGARLNVPVGLDRTAQAGFGRHREAYPATP